MKIAIRYIILILALTWASFVYADEPVYITNDITSKDSKTILQQSIESQTTKPLSFEEVNAGTSQQTETPQQTNSPQQTETTTEEQSLINELSLYFASWDSEDKDGDNEDKEDDQKNDTKTGSWEDDSDTWTGKSDPKNDELNAKVAKNINNLLIESYKSKFDKIINVLVENMEDKPKEQKIKILSSVLYTVNSKIDIMESWKVHIKENRKIVLMAVFKYLRERLQSEISLIAQEN